MTVEGLIGTWRRGHYQAPQRIGVAGLATVPAGFAFDGRLMTRAQFLAYIKATNIAWATGGVVVHHTANPTEATWRQYGGWAYWSRQMASYYHNSLGWHAGPHAYASYEGIGIMTPFSQPGIHAGKVANASYIGIEIVGLFTGALPTGETLTNAVFAFAAMLWKLGKTAAEAMYPHRYFGGTACPGQKLYDNFSWFEGLVDAEIAKIEEAEHPPQPTPPPAPTVEMILADHEKRITALEAWQAEVDAWIDAHTGDGK